MMRKSSSTSSLIPGGGRSGPNSHLGYAAFGGLQDRATSRARSIVVARKQTRTMESLNQSIATDNAMLAQQLLQKKAFVKCESLPVWKVEVGPDGTVGVEQGGKGQTCQLPEASVFGRPFANGEYVRMAPCQCRCAARVLELREWSQQNPSCPR